MNLDCIVKRFPRYRGDLNRRVARQVTVAIRQTWKPRVIWMSARFRDSLALDQADTAKAAEDSVNREKVFSTWLGLLDVTGR